jgi:type IV secretory pathway VirB10-like protein
MPSSRNLLPLAAFLAVAAVASAAENTDAQKKARADFLKQHDKKGATPSPKIVEPALPDKKADAPKKKAVEPKKADAPKKSEGKKATPEPQTPPAADAAEPTPKPQAKLSLPLPKGQDSKGVVIPYTDGAGKKSMVFRIGVGRRLDDDHVDMNDLLIETYDEDGKQEMTIELPGSKLDLNTRVISGDQSVTIKRSDFQLTGKKMEFNTETKQGHVTGDVKMIIYNLSDETGDEGKKGSKGS